MLRIMKITCAMGGVLESRVVGLWCLVVALLLLPTVIALPAPESAVLMDDFYKPCGNTKCDGRSQFCDQVLEMCSSCDECRSDYLNRLPIDRDVATERCNRICPVFMELQEQREKVTSTTTPVTKARPVPNAEGHIKSAPNNSVKIGVPVGFAVMLCIVVPSAGFVLWKRRRGDQQDGHQPEGQPFNVTPTESDGEEGQPDPVHADLDQTQPKVPEGSCAVDIPEQPHSSELKVTVVAQETNNRVAQETDQDRGNPPVISPR